MKTERLITLDEYLTIDQIALTLQVPDEYVQALVDREMLNTIVLPGKLENPIRVSGESFETFIRNCTVKRMCPAVQTQEPKTQQPASPASAHTSHSIFEV